MAQSAASTKAQTAPHPDDPRKPDTPDDLTKRSWKYVLRKSLREFGSDQCTDLAAALVYYAVLALFPALLALISLLGVFGQGQATVDAIKDIIKGIGPASVADTLDPILKNIVDSQGAGLSLVLGIVLALWSASGYVGAFSRAMNRIYEIQEGRPVWKLRPMQLLVTVIAVVLAALALLILVVSGPVARSIGNVIGVGSTAVTVWSIVKWPVLLVIVIVVIAVLYQLTPNIRRPKWSWTSIGAFTAIGVWALASLLFGAELDAELERGRELQAGMPAEETLQLPPKDTRKADKAAAKEEEDVERARALRLSQGRDDDPGRGRA